MAVINNPGLREIALEIVSAPGFSDSEDDLARALSAWRKALTPEQWRSVAEALMCSFLLDVRAEYERDLPAVVRRRAPDPQPPVRGEIRFVDTVAEPEPVDEPAGAVAAAVGAPVLLRHSTESENWSGPCVPDRSGPERLPASPKRRTAPPSSPKFGPVHVSHVADRAAAPEPQGAVAVVLPAAPAKPARLQQDGWRVPAFRNMKVFPSLANRVTVNGVATREGELTKTLIPLRLDQITKQRQAGRDKDTHAQARIDRRNELIRQDEAEMRVRRALDRELQSEADRLAAVERVLAGCPEGTTITELGAEVLVECGYARRSA